MMVRQWLAALLAAVFVSTAPGPASAVDLTSIGVVQKARLPKVQPDWPVPRDRDQMFYLQRSTNPNTIVYAARFDGAGNLDAKNPAAIYWRRFNDAGEVKSLKRIEHVAFGINVRRGDTPGEFTVTLKRLPDIPMLLRQTGPGEAELWATIGGKIVRPIYAYATIDEDRIIPAVTQFSIFGQDPATGRYIGETFGVKGGSIRP